MINMWKITDKNKNIPLTNEELESILQDEQFYDLFDDENNGSVIDSDHEIIDSHDSNSVTEVTDNDDITDSNDVENSDDDFHDYKREIILLREENEKILRRIETLEIKLLEAEKWESKNNIVIKGINLRDKLVKKRGEELRVEATVVTIKSKTRTPHILTEKEKWEKKLKVMKTKNKLKGTNKYIEDYLTAEERKV
ncbi:hypothetical protein FQA39_LY05253 [Lamprigera yunnana]|nr:hypothetical protein FQA39_LY05253 [Lamprigera yunnana]